MSRTPTRHLPEEPSNAELKALLEAIAARLNRGDQRFTAIDEKLNKLDGVAAAAATIVQVAETYKLVGLGGRVTIAVAKLLGAIGAIVAAFYAVRHWMHGTPPTGLN